MVLVGRRWADTAFFSLLCGAVLTNALAQDPFAEGVRTTPFRTPAEEQAMFRLPPGFTIDLVAAEPDIQKPLNLAFDSKGRIWLTDTIEYPYAAPLDKPGRDTLKVLEDADGDGSHEKITTFADGLNIPIGVYPYRDGAIVFSIPHIWFLRDTDGDGRCDTREKLLGPFGWERDTHGMNNAFRRGYDGWIYACHGFNNITDVMAADGSRLQIQSGNTYRFRVDGSRIEQFTWGQVNPFGMTIDPLFNLFTADCHSKPVYQLLRGGYYPSFGKPDDGLGFVPPMMDHLHGSTAICGLVSVDDDRWPEEFRGNFLSGNVMTSRINRNAPQRHGSTILAQELPDFLSCDDPWFRPVDLQLGPDGALYVNDFYNRIIGHYEVPLPHTGRDRTSGRIWRVRPLKTDSIEKRMDLATADVEDLVATLGDPSQARRMLAKDELFDRIGPKALDAVRRAFEQPTNVHQRVHSLWLLHRWDRLGDDDAKLAAADEHVEVRVHLYKALSERPTWSDTLRALATRALKDADAFVVRAAADAIGRHPDQATFAPLLATWAAVPADDNHLGQTLKMALRDHMSDDRVSDAIAASELSADEWKRIGPLFAGCKTEAGSRLMVHYLIALPKGEPIAPDLLRHAARNASESAAPKLVALARKRLADDLSAQTATLAAFAEGFAQRGIRSSEANAWAADVCRRILSVERSQQIQWTHAPLPGSTDTVDPFVVQARDSADGTAGRFFFGSLPRGEQRTGVYASEVFPAPAKLSFWMAGHSGFPDQPDNGKNRVRLIDSESGSVVVESPTPRNDVAQRVEWDLEKHVNRPVRVEIVDADTADAYAWLAAGRFSLEILNPASDEPTIAALGLIGRFKLADQRDQLARALASSSTSGKVQAAAAMATFELRPSAIRLAAAKAIADESLPSTIRTKLAVAMADESDNASAERLAEVFGAASARQQRVLSEDLAGDLAGVERLLALIDQGKAAAALLRAPTISQRIAAHKHDDLNRRVASIVDSLPSESDAAAVVIAQRRETLGKTPGDVGRGQALFAKHCAACHQVAGKGALIGPQLDGIGLRGQDRLLEDLLDPNRNVDVAFRVSTIALKDGRVISALVRRQEGQRLIVADSQGKESAIDVDEVEERSATATSLMPSNVAEVVPAAEFPDLIAYLLQQRQPREPSP